MAQKLQVARAEPYWSCAGPTRAAWLLVNLGFAEGSWEPAVSGSSCDWEPKKGHSDCLLFTSQLCVLVLPAPSRCSYLDASLSGLALLSIVHCLFSFLPSFFSRLGSSYIMVTLNLKTWSRGQECWEEFANCKDLEVSCCSGYLDSKLHIDHFASQPWQAGDHVQCQTDAHLYSTCLVFLPCLLHWWVHTSSVYLLDL